MARKIYHGSNRRKRMRQVKEGPGYFAYDGTAVDHEWKPTFVLNERDTPVVDEGGRIARMSDGRPMYEKKGTPALMFGKPYLGGEPEVVAKPVEVCKLWGHEFPKGEKIYIEDYELAQKLRRLQHFIELEESEDFPEPKKARPARKSKSELEESAPESA